MRSIIFLNLFLGFLFSSTFSVAQGVIQIPLVVHVLYNDVEDSIPTELIETIILDSVNADFRRQNLDAIYTQTAYLPIAADTEIEFHFANTDPSGNPTTGVIYKYTDQTSFNWQLNRGMMYDSLGGADPWDECHYMNLWLCPMDGVAEYAHVFNGQEPSGVVMNTFVFLQFSQYHFYRNLTHNFAHYIGASGFNTSQSCSDSDGISDTPIQTAFPLGHLVYENPDSIFQETVCSSIPEGRLAGNFMMPTNAAYTKYMNMFTSGQKDKMRNFISEHFPGFINSEVSCLTGIEENSEKFQFGIYPNPSPGLVTVSLGNASITQVAALTIFDSTGRLVFQQNVENSNQLELNLQLPNGVYFMKLATENLFHTEKLLIQ